MSELWDRKTKPRGSLGRIEEVGTRIVEIRGGVPARLRAAIVVAAADHGVAAEGVSAYPAEVTAQMLANFRAGGAAVCVLARHAGAQLIVEDRGVGRPTANFLTGPAMTRAQAEEHLHAGAARAEALDVDLVALGEMGIGNSTAAAALAAKYLGVPARAVCGRGTGLDDDGVARKAEVVERALAANPVSEPIDVLAALGGFEIAYLAGVALGAARSRKAVMLDGVIASAAALAAARIDPTAAGSMLASHRSPEPAHALILEALGLEPLLDLGLRLGEGSGAALALPLLSASIALLNDMAEFEEAGVTDTGR